MAKQSVQCDICGAWLIGTSLSKHKKHWHKYSCEYCDVTFPTKENLRTHCERMKYHFAPLNYECDICKEKFELKYDLLRHKKTHTKNQFACKKCGSTFDTFKKLKVHRSRHVDKNANYLGNSHLKIINGLHILPSSLICNSFPDLSLLFSDNNM